MSAPREQLSILLQDLRYGARVLGRSPGFLAVAILTMALGIGASTAVFSLTNAVLIRSLPYGDASRLVYLWTPIPKLPDVPRELGPSYPDYYDWTRRSRSFESLALFDEGYVHLDSATRVGGARVTAGFFETLEAAPQLGRATFAEGERAVVIGDGLWRSRFGGDPGVLGRTLEVDRQRYTIVGVMPPHFGYPHATDVRYPDSPQNQTDLWMPLALTEREKSDRTVGSGGTVVARLKPGVTVRQAQAEMAAIEAQLDPLYPPDWRGWTAYVQPFLDSALGPVRLRMWLLMGAVAMVLAICCANIANLLVARGAGRAREMSVRSAVGASRARLVRQMLTESLLMAGAGGVAGVLAGLAAMRVLVRLAPATIPRIDETTFDGRVLLFALAASVMTGLAFGVLPALAASRAAITITAAPRRSRMRSLLIVSEVGLAVMLVAVAGLLLRSFQKLAETDIGFARSTLTMTVTPADRFRREMLDEIRRIPGVAIAGAGDDLPLAGHYSMTNFMIEGHAISKSQLVEARTAGGGYCEAMHIRLLAGRYLSDDDGPNRPPVALISRRFRDLYFRGENAVGRRMRPCSDCQEPWYTIVGVVEDVRHGTLEETPKPVMYAPLWRTPSPRMNLAIETRMPAERIVPAVRRVVGSAMYVADVRTMNELVTEAGAARRFQTTLLTAFAALALLLAAVGLYGMVAYAVKHRTKEIGVRMAVGAGRGRILGMVLRQGMTPAVVGMALGLAGAAAATRLIASWLYGVTRFDAVTFAAVPVVLLAVAAAACIVPAWRATRVDPVGALRHE
jgi:putative ABC transport system permease protein